AFRNPRATCGVSTCNITTTLVYDGRGVEGGYMQLYKLAWLMVFPVVSVSVSAQNSASIQPPQSARQALIKMFFGSADDFTKHLPDEAKSALIRKGDTPEASIVLKIASIGREVSRTGQRVETFETGPNILILEDEANHERMEIAVEHDSLLGEDDE